MASVFRRLLQRGMAFPLVQTISSTLWGGAGTVRETFAGEWQVADRYALAGKVKRSPLAHSGVYTSINVISSDIAKLPARIMRPRTGGGGREEHTAHPLNRLLRKPNRFQTSLQFFQQYYASKLWTGNTYVVLMRDERGVPKEMYVLDPRTTSPALTEDGSLWYLVKADRMNRLEQDTYITARDILHDRGVTLFHPLVGVSPLFAAAVSASIGNSITGHSEKFFENLARTSGVLTTAGEIPTDTADRLKRDWDSNYSGNGFGKVAVLGSGLTWTPLTMNAVDAQLIEQLRWSVEDIGRVYRVPAFMLGETKITYRNSEQLSRMYFQGCLSYHIEATEQCFKDKFELDPSYDVEFDLSPLFRLETDLRYSTHERALRSGIKSINEVRAEEDLPPVKGGEEPRLQMQYIPLSQVNDAANSDDDASKPKPAPAPTPDPADDEGDDDAEDKGAADADLVEAVYARLLSKVKNATSGEVSGG